MKLELLIGLAGLAGAQQLNCNKLPATTLCGPEFAGYPVNKPTEEFNNNLQWFIASLQNMTVQMTASGACKNDVADLVGDFRYMISSQCAFNIQKAIKDGCPVQDGLFPQGPIICQDQCEIALESVSIVMNDKSICPKNLTTPVEYAQSCENTRKYSSQTNCIVGSPLELKTCGKCLLM
jgi:hypothetical protein